MGSLDRLRAHYNLDVWLAGRRLNAFKAQRLSACRLLCDKLIAELPDHSHQIRGTATIAVGSMRSRERCAAIRTRRTFSSKSAPATAEVSGRPGSLDQTSAIFVRSDRRQEYFRTNLNR